MPVPLRGDFDAHRVRVAAKRSKDGPQARRRLALAAIYDGATRTEAAKIGGVTVQIVRDWVLKFNAQGPDGLIDRKASLSLFDRDPSAWAANRLILVVSRAPRRYGLSGPCCAPTLVLLQCNAVNKIQHES